MSSRRGARRNVAIWAVAAVLMGRRMKEVFDRLRPNAEEAAALRRALDEVALMQVRDPIWKRLLRNLAWLAAMAFVGWVVLVIF